MPLLSRPVAAHDAVVLRTWPTGESSLVVSLLAEEHGYVKVIAKAARRAASALRAVTQPGRLVNVEFGLEPRRELQFLRGGSLLLDPLAVGATLERSAFLLAAMEIVDRCRPSAQADGGAFALCRRYLQVLSCAAPGDEAAAFYLLELAWLDLHGVAPAVDVCAGCSVELAARGALWFSPASGGAICDRCVGARGGADSRALTAAAHRTLRALLDARDTWRTEAPDRGTAREVGVLLHRFLGYHLPGYRLPAALELLRPPSGRASADRQESGDPREDRRG